MEDQLYVLKLDAGKWYIGRTANVERRFQQHCDGTGAKWTGLHRPISIELSRPLLSEEDEDRTTRDYMVKYGIYNVRGGQYCAVELKKWNIKQIHNDIAGDVAVDKYNKNKKERAKQIAEITEKVTEITGKVWNEIANSDSDLRSGRWLRGLLGGIQAAVSQPPRV
jgi:predicted GIY-YIG superfamily endonuclease